MYQFFMGPKCNIYYKDKNDPTVIEVRGKASDLINNWLERNNLDFDILVSNIIAITNTQVEKILHEENNIFNVIFTSGKEASLELMDGDEAQYSLILESGEWYMFRIEGNETITELKQQSVNGINYTANSVKNLFRIETDPVTLVIKPEKFDISFMEVMKEHIEEIDTWDGLLDILLWMASLPVQLDAYELIISSFDKQGRTEFQVYVIHNQIFSLSLKDETGSYHVEQDGSWQAETKVFFYKYNPFEKIYKGGIVKNYILPSNAKVITLSNGLKVTLINGKEHFYEVKDICELLINTLQFINGILS